MIGTLGIIGENEQMKFKTEIDMITNEKVLSVQLYGWGQNVNHNLATYYCNVVQQPKQIDLPDCFMIKSQEPDYMSQKQQYIKQIKCGIRNSALVSNTGQVWMCGNLKQEKILKYVDTEEGKLQADKEFAMMVDQGKKNSKKQNKNQQKAQQFDETKAQELKEKEKSLQHRWTDCTSIFNKQNEGLNYGTSKIVFISNALVLAECYYSF